MDILPHLGQSNNPSLTIDKKELPAVTGFDLNSTRCQYGWLLVRLIFNMV